MFLCGRRIKPSLMKAHRNSKISPIRRPVFIAVISMFFEYCVAASSNFKYRELFRGGEDEVTLDEFVKGQVGTSLDLEDAGYAIPNLMRT